MNDMAASGLGADSSSPMTFPFPNSAGYYRSEEEEEEAYEVDNGFDYIPADESSGVELPNKLMATVLTASTTVIEQQTS
ncbi:hypothetical protein V7S43_008506 [Phytophthora oleae]|uniref:Uncharacterized protein n=1 Tax=Phytophthora oleae TaxID=2107226 RepID=A0ABD3FH50_9STRA